MKSLSIVTLSLVVAAGLLISAFAQNLQGQGNATVQENVSQDSNSDVNYARVVNSGIEYLLSQQADDGSWAKEQGSALTAMAVTALLENGRTARDPAVVKGLAYLRGFAQPDGGIYSPSSTHRNYETCLAMLCFTAVNSRGQHDELIAGMDKFLRGLQWDEDEGLKPSEFAYGGAGYGNHSRPDLSNTQFFMEALKAAGADEDDPALQKALAFVSRTQNLESEHNTTPFSTKINDGGFYYTPAAGGTSQVDSELGDTGPDGGLRSYGSMTYAGLKSMIYAGVTKDDLRVKAATQWIRQHYTTTENPGIGAAGLFYYYQTFAKALAAVGEDNLTDAKGQQHNWRQDLITELARRQNKDGSWVNEKNSRWMEGNPVLVTSYALLALADAKPVE
ncbi:MAG: terpene cyclase/mutase family protein [Pirellulales bacterium]|nr:terpene cyclase/mutase family protein [Pirellulales bacterium]